MNRIQQGLAPARPTGPSLSRIDHAPIARSRHSVAHYSLFMPMHYEKNYAYPLMVWLHSDGEDERQLQQIMPQISMRNYVAVAPRGSHRYGKRPGFCWAQNEACIDAAAESVDECIELAIQKTNIHPGRIFIGGSGDGGTMAFRIGLRASERFAGVLSVGGGFPDSGAPLSNLRHCRRIPLFLAHARQSCDYPVDRMCRELQLFHVAGFSVTLRQYPGEDQLTRQILRDLNVWVMEQVTGQRTEDS